MLQIVWTWFMQLHHARGFTDMGTPKPLAYSEMLAWATLMDTTLTPFEVEVIKRLDNVALTEGRAK